MFLLFDQIKAVLVRLLSETFLKFNCFETNWVEVHNLVRNMPTKHTPKKKKKSVIKQIAYEETQMADGIHAQPEEQIFACSFPHHLAHRYEKLPACVTMRSG